MAEGEESRQQAIGEIKAEIEKCGGGGFVLSDDLADRAAAGRTFLSRAPDHPGLYLLRSNCQHFYLGKTIGIWCVDDGDRGICACVPDLMRGVLRWQLGVEEFKKAEWVGPLE